MATVQGRAHRGLKNNISNNLYKAPKSYPKRLSAVS